MKTSRKASAPVNVNSERATPEAHVHGCREVAAMAGARPLARGERRVWIWGTIPTRQRAERRVAARRAAVDGEARRVGQPLLHARQVGGYKHPEGRQGERHLEGRSVGDEREGGGRSTCTQNCAPAQTSSMSTTPHAPRSRRRYSPAPLRHRGQTGQQQLESSAGPLRPQGVPAGGSFEPHRSTGGGRACKAQVTPMSEASFQV